MSGGETSRSLSSDVKTQLASGSFNMAHLVKLSNSVNSGGIDSLEDFTPPPLNAEGNPQDWQSGSHSNIGGVSSASGTGALFNIFVSGDGEVVTFTIASIGSGYVDGETIVVTDPGNTPQTCTLTVIVLTGNHYFTDSISDVVDGDDTYLANGFLQGLSAVTESSNINIGSTALRISGVNQTVISDVLNFGHLHRTVIIKRAILDDSDAVIDTFEIYKGFVEGMTITDSGETSSVNFSIANHWADFERIEGRATNNSSQQHFYDNDLGFEFSDQASKKIMWGDIIVDVSK